MAANPENITQVSSMPIPPMHYVKLYTDEAVKRGTAPRLDIPCQKDYFSVILISGRLLQSKKLTVCLE